MKANLRNSFADFIHLYKYFRGKLLGSSSEDFFEYRLSTWREAVNFSFNMPNEATKLKCIAKCLFSYWDGLPQSILGITTAQDAIMFTFVPHRVGWETLLKQNMRY